MKAITELSKQELINLILNSTDIGIAEKNLECAGCGTVRNYYVCDKCSEEEDIP